MFDLSNVGSSSMEPPLRSTLPCMITTDCLTSLGITWQPGFLLCLAMTWAIIGYTEQLMVSTQYTSVLIANIELWILN